MKGLTIIRIPARHYKEAKEFKRMLQKEKNINIPIWRCFLAVEESKKTSDKIDPFWGRLR